DGLAHARADGAAGGAVMGQEDHQRRRVDDDQRPSLPSSIAANTSSVAYSAAASRSSRAAISLMVGLAVSVAISSCMYAWRDFPAWAARVLRTRIWSSGTSRMVNTLISAFWRYFLHSAELAVWVRLCMFFVSVSRSRSRLRYARRSAEFGPC